MSSLVHMRHPFRPLPADREPCRASSTSARETEYRYDAGRREQSSCLAPDAAESGGVQLRRRMYRPRAPQRYPTFSHERSGSQPSLRSTPESAHGGPPSSRVPTRCLRRSGRSGSRAKARTFSIRLATSIPPPVLTRALGLVFPIAIGTSCRSPSRCRRLSRRESPPLVPPRKTSKAAAIINASQ